MASSPMLSPPSPPFLRPFGRGQTRPSLGTRSSCGHAAFFSRGSSQGVPWMHKPSVEDPDVRTSGRAETAGTMNSVENEQVATGRGDMRRAWSQAAATAVAFCFFRTPGRASPAANPRAMPSLAPRGSGSDRTHPATYHHHHHHHHHHHLPFSSRPTPSRHRRQPRTRLRARPRRQHLFF